MNSRPELDEQIKEVKKKASTGPRSNKASSNQKDRVERRLRALIQFEGGEAAISNT